MAYNFLTDFVGLWRATTGGVEKAEMPGLDFVVAALGRAGILNLVISGSPPVVNQATTAWFKPAVPDYAAEGVLYLWNGTMYVPATPGLFYTFLSISLGASGLAIWLVTGAPSDLVGNNGDIALRTDAPGGIYGPKAAGSWPVDPLPGTSYSQISAFLDVLGATQGDIVYRGAGGWAVLAPGAAGQVLGTGGAAANPLWVSPSSFTITSAQIDAAFGGVQGDILYRNATVWTVLPPGAAGQLLQTGGAAANPSWASAAAAYVLNSAKVDAAFGATVGGVLTRSGAGWVNSGQGAVGTVLAGQGAFSPIWATLSAMLDTIGQTQGSILYRNATTWVPLAPGAAGQFLQTLGAGANPLWASPATTAPAPGAIGSYALGNGTNAYDTAGANYAGTWLPISQIPGALYFHPGSTDASAGAIYLMVRIA